MEDNIVYCEYVCNMLSREGYRNMKAYHLSTAKKHLQQATDNDIVVADLRLPDGSGIDLLCWMRKEGKMQPFIIMTDYAEVNTAVESMKLGSIDYIPKQLVEDKLARDDCRMAVGGGETCAFVIIYPPLEGVRSPRSGIVKDTVQCRDRFAELDYQRLIGRVHSLSSFPFFAFSHLSRAARHSSNVGLTQENNSLSMGWR